MRDITMHELAVMALQRAEPAIQRHGFAAAIRKLIRDHAEWFSAHHPQATPEETAAVRAYDIEDLTELWRRCGIRPDAFKIEFIDQECPVLTVYEIEDTSALSVRKMLGICDLYWLVDALYGDLHVIVLDRYGQNRRELNVSEWERNYWRAARPEEHSSQ